MSGELDDAANGRNQQLVRHKLADLVRLCYSCADRLGMDLWE